MATTVDATSDAGSGIDRTHRRVIAASSLGTMFEWYDFYLYGSLAAIIGKQFFAGVNETTGFIFALLAFAAGFAVRPFGAIIFGRLGDLTGRKHTFLITIVIMGVATALVGVLPNQASIGVAAPIILIALRLLQGLAVGGEYGGAATYIAEHAPPGRRAYYTSWIQITATAGMILSLIVILGCRWLLGDEFETWGWRVPFLLSIILLAISVYIRMQLEESPVFREMRAAGKLAKNPLRESLGRWSNLKLVLLALFGAMAGQAVVGYISVVYMNLFLTQTLKVDAVDVEPARRCSTDCRRAVLHRRRQARRSHRPQAAGHDRLSAGCADALPDLPRAHALRESADRSGAGEQPGGRRRRSARVQFPVRPGRRRAVHELVRRRQECGRRSARPVFE